MHARMHTVATNTLLGSSPPTMTSVMLGAHGWRTGARARTLQEPVSPVRPAAAPGAGAHLAARCVVRPQLQRGRPARKEAAQQLRQRLIVAGLRLLVRLVLEDLRRSATGAGTIYKLAHDTSHRAGGM